MPKIIGAEHEAQQKPGFDRRRLKQLLDALSTESLFELGYLLQVGLERWKREHSTTSFDELRAAQPQLEEIIDFDLISQRLQTLSAGKRYLRATDPGKCVPELMSVQESCRIRLGKIPPSIDKAASYLRPIALRAGADTTIEAAIYFASRGTPLLDAHALTRCWHTSLLEDLRYRANTYRWSEAMRERLKSDHLSLAELARLASPSRVLAAPYRTDPLAETALFRAVEWLELTGFEPWLAYAITELSQGPEFGPIGHYDNAWTLFQWCRSTRALEAADRMGLETWLRTLTIGDTYHSLPWRLWLPHHKDHGSRDYLPVAAIIAFAWHRIQPERLKDNVLRAALELLLQTQMADGGWPLLLGDSRASVLSTSLAVHALSQHKPSGWQRLATRAAEWLLLQQRRHGLWKSEEDADPVWLAVLVLDALELAAGGSQVTFATAATVTREPQPEPYVFRKDGSAFFVAFADEGHPYPAKIGLRYLHALLVHQGEEFFVDDLYSLVQREGDRRGVTFDSLADQETHLGLEGDSGEVLDERAIAELRRNLERLQEEIAEAQEFEDDSRLTTLDGQFHAIGHTLQISLDRRGKSRRLDSRSERQRKSVGKALRDAIGLLAADNPELGAFLGESVQIRTVCCYRPVRPLRWRLR